MDTPLHPRIIKEKKALLSIIVDDFGSFDGVLLDAFCRLDPAVTFAVLPELPFSQIAMERAIASGREVIVHIPMQAQNTGINPGQNAILSINTPREIYDKVRGYFRVLTKAVGANNHMGSLITQDKDLMQASLRYLAENNLFFVDSRTVPNTVVREVALELGISFAERDLFLDAPDNTDEVLWERIRNLARLLRTKGRALVITHCDDKDRLDRLKIFIDEAKRMGFELVPTSEFVQSLNSNLICTTFASELKDDGFDFVSFSTTTIFWT